MTDFDAVIDRRDTGSVKWDRYRDTDIIPLWVADMDFPAPVAVLDALQERVRHGIFGYGNAPRGLLDTVIEYIAASHHWVLRPEWVVWLPGLVTGINLSCRAVGALGDDVLTMTPVYPPFLSAPRLAGRGLVTVPLVQGRDGVFALDWVALEGAVTPVTRLLLLCNPHNPVGRAYARTDLERLGEFCARHDLIICADEIHAGLILDEDKTHVSIASLSPELAKRTITLLAPSKTFNIPGLGFSFAVIPDAALRTRFRAEMRGIVPDVNVLGYVAGLAAYRDGAAWQRALIAYLRANRDLVINTLGATPGLKTTPVEATYLAWIDARGLGVENPQRFFETAGVGLSDGTDFGAPGFVRLNFGCQRTLLEEALARIGRAVAGR
ncbi:MAG TPA: PatB family C-S lyase [Acidiferrobacter sp.]|nr:PatB family C-S lyase [Acidiferrobacter sp.]